MNLVKESPDSRPYNLQLIPSFSDHYPTPSRTTSRAESEQQKGDAFDGICTTTEIDSWPNMIRHACAEEFFLLYTSNLQQSWGAEVSKRERDYRKE